MFFKGILDLFKGKNTYPNMSYDIGDGYHVAYKEVSNGRGGYTNSEICLYNGNKLIKQLVSETGEIQDFPGVEHGEWEKDLTSELKPYVHFSVSVGAFNSEGLADFVWMVQPDGCYWRDEDGFGMTNDEEITLYSKINKTGKFVTPFKHKK